MSWLDLYFLVRQMTTGWRLGGRTCFAALVSAFLYHERFHTSNAVDHLARTRRFNRRKAYRKIEKFLHRKTMNLDRVWRWFWDHYTAQVGCARHRTAKGPAMRIIPMAPIVTPDYTITHTTTTPTLDEFVVEQMNFKKQNGFDINEIALTSNDHVTFDGDGCVNRGGYGGPGFNTCYLWVDPVDGNGDPASYYYGMVTVRGNPLLYGAQLRNIRGTEFNISSPGVVPVHVSYMDNYFPDNSNNITDGGPHHQCDGVAAARLRVRVRHGGVATTGIPPKLYDLTSTAFDGNGLMLNPMFFTQTVSGQDAAVGYPKSMAVQSEQEFYANRWYDPHGMGALTPVAQSQYGHRGVVSEN